MSTIDELLDEQLEAEENHICVIDKLTRKITMHEECKFFGVQHDKRVERIKFECPKEVGDENVDLTTCKTYIAYENANGDPGLYEIKDLVADDDVVHFSWLFDEDVTLYHGNVNFIFYATKLNLDNNETENAWNTIPAQGFVEDGLDVINQIGERYPSIMEELLIKIAVLEHKLEDGVAGTVEIVDVISRPPGSSPTLTETEDSTPEAKKYILGVPSGVRGAHGVGIVSTVVIEDTEAGETIVSLEYSDGTNYEFSIPHGTVSNESLAQAIADYMKEHGGGSVVPGEDGFSPVANVTQTDVGVVISITDKDGTTTATVTNGKDGQDGYTPQKGIDYFDGQPGKDGTSVTHSWNGTVLTVTSASGTSSVDLKGEPGDDGADGQDGKDGTSPVVSVSAITGGHRITITDVNGTKTVDVIDGSDGQDGTDGQDGADGVSVTHEWDGTVLKVTSASGTSSADLKGGKGDKGDIGPQGIPGVSQVPLFANSIEECTDTTKVYVLPDGFIYAYMPSTGPGYTNLAGTITYDKRLSSSGKVSSSDMPGAAYTDFIPVKQGQVVRIKNFDIFSDFSSSAFPYVCFYTGASESNVASNPAYARPGELTEEFIGAANAVNGDVVTWTAFTVNGGAQHTLASSITHIRISGKYFTDKEIIVTVDEEITEGSGGGYTWQNTGHAFVPADYESEIVDLQKNKADKTEIPTKLPSPNALIIDGVEYDGSKSVTVNTESGGNILYGKKWVACGDSFTHGGYNASDGFDSSVYVYQDGRFAGKNIVYPYIIGLRNNMNIVNKASGGQTMAASSNSFMSVYQNIDADADYITIMLGINDKVQGLPVGELEDSAESTFCGAFNVAMEHILENHPFAHIGIMVSHGTNEEIMEATRGIAERWGVPYLDYGSPQVPLMNRYTGRNVCAKAQEIRERNFCVISDGTTVTNAHPNTAAHEYESTFIEAWLRTL